MRVAGALAIVCLVGVLTASALTRTTARAANPKLVATVGPGFTISLEDTNGNTVTSLTPGTYDIEVHDNDAAHNFDLQRPGGATENNTSIGGTGVVTWTVELTAGTWTYVCDAHASMNGSFTVGTPATTTVTTGTTATTGTTGTTATTSTTSTTGATATTGTTGATVTTETTGNPGVTATRPRRCVVPRLVRKKLAAARNLVARAGCRLGRVRRAYSSKIGSGRVLAQRPRAGARVARGTRVHVAVSRGPRR
jgi:plastocyanin